MGRSITPKYAMVVHCGRHSTLSLTWDGKNGTPSEATLAKWVRSFNASLEPGGNNAHLKLPRVSRAVVKYNRPSGEVVARYTAPMFEVL